MTLTEQQTIPAADLRHFLEGSTTEKAAFVETIGCALRDVGFFSLGGHGISEETLKNAYGAIDTLFKLPTDVKKKYEIPGILGDRGFTSFGKEQAVGAPVPDLKEFWHVGIECDPLPEGQLPNVWPEEVPAFKPSLTKLYDDLMETALHLLRACSLYLSEPENLLADMAVGGNTCLRTIHYPPIPEDAAPQSIRAAAHEDINFITLLVESTASGLEILERDGTWRPIFTQGGHIVVDAGDMLQRLTNGYFRATTHRVVNPENSRERRYSMPFFVHPKPEVSLAALPSCLEKTGGEKRWPDCTAEEYREERLINIGLNK